MTKNTQTLVEQQASLDAILRELENDTLDIDQAVKRYEAGLKLIDEMQAQLKQTENTITKLSKKFEEA